MQTEQLISKRAPLTGEVPRHVAIIMDGNRRWAKKKGLPTLMGHWHGAEVLTKIVRAANACGVKVLTVYTFSTENWSRSQEEVDMLMDLLRTYLIEQREEMLQEGVKLDAIGDFGKLPASAREIIEETKILTAHCERIELVLAVNYGGRDDIRRAALAIVDDCLNGKLKKEDLSEQVFGSYLDTAPWGDPDLLIRTSGELRLSNFLLWQISYAEVYITEVLWPDFDEKEFSKAISEYKRRERRLGGR
jgi:undecaprenyl diphosphate synthase